MPNAAAGADPNYCQRHISEKKVTRADDRDDADTIQPSVPAD